MEGPSARIRDAAGYPGRRGGVRERVKALTERQLGEQSERGGAQVPQLACREVRRQGRASAGHTHGWFRVPPAAPCRKGWKQEEAK